MSDEYEAFEPRRCEDCGIRIDRHGSECGMEIDDPRAEGYFPPAGWARPAGPDGELVCPRGHYCCRARPGEDPTCPVCLAEMVPAEDCDGGSLPVGPGERDDA